jgi:hypothetical protein
MSHQPTNSLVQGTPHAVCLNPPWCPVSVRCVLPVFGPAIKLHCVAAASQDIVYVCRPLLLPDLRQALWYACQHCASTSASGQPLLLLESDAAGYTGHDDVALSPALLWAADV